MTHPFRLLLLSLALLSLGLGVAPVAAARPQPARAPKRVDGEALGSVAVANIIFRPQDTTQIGGANPEMRLRLTEELRKFGYAALGGEDLVFGKDKAGEAKFLLGATITALECEGEQAPAAAGQGTTRRVDCKATLKWQLLERGADTVVYEVTTRQGEVDYAITDEASWEALAQQIVVNSLHALLVREKFADALRPRAVEPVGSVAMLGYRACRVSSWSSKAETEGRLGRRSSSSRATREGAASSSPRTVSC